MKKTFCQNLLPGVLLVVAISLLATWLAGVSWVSRLHFSPLIVGIVLGMVFANTLRRFVPSGWSVGINYCAKQVLRLGIVLFGFKVTLGQVLDVGAAALATDVLVVVGTMLLGVLLGRVLRMDAQTALLTTVGSSICGAAAVLGAEPVVNGAAHKTSVAVSTVVIFGTIAMFLYPALYRADAWDLSPRQVAVYTGATLHEVAHVVGAGNAIDTAALSRDIEDSEEGRCIEGKEGQIEREAVIVKMIRVMLLAPVLIVMSLFLCRRQAGVSRVKVPAFAFLFLLVIGFNSLDWLPPFYVRSIQTADAFLLTMAMTALGVETSVDKFLKAGVKPFLLALFLFVWLVVGGYWLVKAVTCVF